MRQRSRAGMHARWSAMREQASGARRHLRRRARGTWRRPVGREWGRSRSRSTPGQLTQWVHQALRRRSRSSRLGHRAPV
eukprot:10811060-Alexandrium_andersonii.AAC.1